jgi:tetratricopeptide (TPR) repeat protein
MAVENFYPGLFRPPEFMPETAYSDLFVGYRIPFQKLGATTSVRLANQLAEVTSRLNTGMKIVEAGVLSPVTFEQIPKQHFEEIGRLAELTGAEITWHFPFVELSGVADGRIDETERKSAEAFMWNFVEKVMKSMRKPQPITIHPAVSGIPPSYFGEEEKMKIGVYDAIDNRIGMVDIKNVLSREEIEKYKDQLPKVALEKINQHVWRKSFEPLLINLSEFVSEARVSEKIMEEIENRKRLLDSIVARETARRKNNFLDLSEEEKREILKLEDAKQYYSEMKALEMQLNAINLRFNRLVDVEKELLRISKESGERGMVEGSLEEIKKAEEYFNKALQLRDQNKIEEASSLMINSINLLWKNVPKVMDFSENVVKEKIAETVSNVAIKAYENFKDNAPVFCFENLFPTMAFGNAESLKALIEETRQKFVEKMKPKIGEKKAKEIAEKIIGATWDIGHINIWKKYGVKPEEIKVEMEKIRPFIKHIHIADNFGFEDSHLPPGMGGIEPEIFGKIKEIIEKQGAKAVLEIPTLAIPEYGFGVSPYPYAFAGLGSPIYTYTMAPFWNQALAAELPAYFTGYGPILPERHFEFYGGGFAALPVELGGQAKRQTFAGAPIE